MNKQQLRQAIKNLPALPNDAPLFSWLDRRKTIRQHILNDDYDFLNWSVIQATMDTTGKDQYTYFRHWQKQTGLNIKQMNSIVEFGGGFGAMAKLCFDYGFVGQYTLIDFPELLLLQEYYLSNQQIDNIQYINTLQPYKVKADLMIAACSLSEVDHREKDTFLNQVTFNHFLVVYQPYWGWSNVQYFEDKLGGKSEESPYYKNHRIIVK